MDISISLVFYSYVLMMIINENFTRVNVINSVKELIEDVRNFNLIICLSGIRLTKLQLS